jgi:hypothetical protein
MPSDHVIQFFVGSHGAAQTISSFVGWFRPGEGSIPADVAFLPFIIPVVKQLFGGRASITISRANKENVWHFHSVRYSTESS